MNKASATRLVAAIGTWWKSSRRGWLLVVPSGGRLLCIVTAAFLARSISPERCPIVAEM
jgi:hypothetical protein